MSDDGAMPALIGRTQEFKQLKELLAAAASSVPAIVLLVGEPGVGKTTLAAALARTRCRRIRAPFFDVMLALLPTRFACAIYQALSQYNCAPQK